jgi:hypothetical protein
VRSRLSEADLQSIFSDPPRVHLTAPGGVWGTHYSCYQFIVSQTTPECVTLETGIGLSTAVFGAIGSMHTAIAPDADEGERLEAWAARTGRSLDRVRMIFEPSEEVLPRLEIEPVDVFFVDGGHAFPIPHIDWFYGAAHLRRGGLLILDDRHLYGVRVLEDTLRLDPRWQLVRCTEKWVAFRRLSEGPLAEGIGDQPFPHHKPSLRRRLFSTLPAGLRSRVRKLVQGR